MEGPFKGSPPCSNHAASMQEEIRHSCAEYYMTLFAFRTCNKFSGLRKLKEGIIFIFSEAKVSEAAKLFRLCEASRRVYCDI